jgi:hypothetical protein
VKILYVSQYLSLEIEPRRRAAELSRDWVGAEDEVAILTGFPDISTGTVPSEYRGNRSGVVIARFPRFSKGPQSRHCVRQRCIVFYAIPYPSGS